MAHITKTNELAVALIGNLTGCAKDDAGFRRLFDQTTKILKSPNHVRTNQFDVKSKLSGLVEKFEVLNRDELAIGLLKRLDELPTESQWMPEILALLLSLSDKPAEKTRIEDLDELAKQPEAVPGLTWDDIIANDPREDSDIWESIEHGYHSSGDEAMADEDDVTISTEATSIAEDDAVTLARQYVVYTDESVRDDAKAAITRHDDLQTKTVVCEYYILRETLSLLHGLPTTVFQQDQRTGRISISGQFQLGTATGAIMQKSLTHSAQMGLSLNFLRQWIRERPTAAYLESCQDALQELLRAFASRLTTLECKYILPKTDVAVSIIDTQREIESSIQPLLRLSALLAESQVRSKTAPFAYLDALFDEACIAQLSCNTPLFDALVQVLLAGLKTYLRPLSIWIHSGELQDVDQKLLVTEAEKACTLGRMWHDRFRMRVTPSGQPNMPKFLQPLAARMFALGNSRAFLSALKNNTGSDEVGLRSLPDFALLLDPACTKTMLPFSETLINMIEIWMTETAKDCTPILCDTLLYGYGAFNIFGSLTTIFCSKDGRTFEAFADTLFWRIENNLRWHDEFLLTELAQSTLGRVLDVNASTLVATQEEPGHSEAQRSSIVQLASLKLDLLFSPAVQNITHTTSPAAYSKIFTSLLQVYRAKSLLRGQSHDLLLLDKRSSALPFCMRSALRMRQSLLVIVDVLHYHITNTAETLSTNFCQALQTADGIDAMVIAWQEHEKLMESSLLLATNLKPIRNTMNRLLELCESFSRLWTKLIATVGPGESGGISNMDATMRVSQLQEDFKQSLSFLATGTRSISRAGGNAALESLADRLQWSAE